VQFAGDVPVAPAEGQLTQHLQLPRVVDEVGAGVTGVAVGEEVMAPTVTGSYAEYALADDFALKPAGLGWETAAALPVAVETADRVLDTLGVTAGETLLVHGAAGAVGAFGVQLAVARGATVVGTASPRNHDYLRSLGAILVTYGDGLADRVRALTPQGVDAVFDVAGQAALDVSIELRAGTDRIVTITDLRAFDLGIVFSGSNRRFGTQLADYAQLVADDTLSVRVAASFPLADAGRAHELSETGHPGGKVILIP
jgi:NADPH:quinone reductase-like Zn-dependent oxidoreductase